MVLMASLTACSGGNSSSESSSSNSSSPAAQESSLSAATASKEQGTASSAAKKILVVYFSQTGHTRTVANQIHDQAGGDLFEIVTVTPYPTDYNTLLNQAQKEQNENFRPPLKTKVEDMGSYDTVFVGSPVWWGTIAPPVKTFLSEYDFSGKTIVPFTTHGGSGLGSSVADIKKLCPNATVLENGLAIRDSEVNGAQKSVSDWLNKLKITK